MGEVLEFKRPKKKAQKGKLQNAEQKATTLCRHGFHKWVIKTDKKFDVKRGKLVTVLQCARCGKEKIELR